jgi:hypothetical protein
MLGVDSVDFEAVAGGGGRIWAAGRAMSGCAGVPGLFERVDERWVPVAGSVGLDVRDLWAAAGNDVWAVGDGTARHFDGTAWTATTLPEPVLLLGVHGVAPDDVWAVGQATDTRVGAAARFDGTAWTVQRIGPAGLLLRDVFAVAADDVWAVGSSGADETADGHVWHWDGAAWSETAAPATAPLAGVWGVAANDVWAVGWSAQVLHWNGSAWSAGDDGGGGDCTFNDVWAAGPADVWAVGDAGCIAHRDRAGWRVVPPVHDWTPLRAVWGASAAQVFAVGYDGTVLLREP